jgi:uncharacterized membrane protein
MYSKAKIAGHPIHPMLIPFPIAFYTSTFLALVVHRATGDAFWYRAAIVANTAGVIMAVIAAIPGVIDYVSGIPRGSHASATGRNHALLNTAALLLFAINLGYIWDEWNEPVTHSGPAIVLSVLGLLATVGAGFFGWRMVQTHHVGVLPLSKEDYDDAARAHRLDSDDVERRHVTPSALAGR